MAEILLWENIRRKVLGCEFHRQVPLDDFIVDFYCHELKLAIEVDCSSHDNDTVQRNDVRKHEKLESLGVRIFRISENDVKRKMTEVLDSLVVLIEQIKKPE
jgi:very-short-patch-repair endonuclease